MLPSKWASDSDPISPPKNWSETVSMFSNIRDTIIIYINLISFFFVILHLCFSNLKRYGCLTGASTLKSWASKKSSPSQIAKLRVSWHRRRIHWVRFTYGQRPCKRYAIYLYYAYWACLNNHHLLITKGPWLTFIVHYPLLHCLGRTQDVDTIDIMW